MSGRIDLTGLTLRYRRKDRPALDAVDLHLPSDAMVAVVGPSGSGKTCLLRIIAGLEMPNVGRVSLDGVDVTEVGPARRPSTMVFQGEALFPELTVRANVGYGLAMSGWDASSLTERVDLALLQFGLAGVAHLRPHQLSGGQARRTALARAWLPRPAVLLLDEPLAGLEAGLRRHLLDLIRRTHARLGGTVVHVTHDLGEALSTADLIVVLQDGRVRQVGAPREVYAQPADAFVAEFLGPATILPLAVSGTTPTCDPATGDVVRRTAHLHLWGAPRDVPAPPDAPEGPHCGTVLARPHALALQPLPHGRVRPEIRGDIALIQEVRFYGERVDYLLETEAGTTLASGPADGALAVDDHVRIQVRADRLWLLPGQGDSLMSR